MRDATLRVLILEDNEADAELLLVELRRLGYRVASERTFSAKGLEAALGRGPWDVVISDYEMPSFGALEALRIIRAVDESIPVIVVSGRASEETAASTLRAGACDFIGKGNLERLGPALARMLGESRPA